MGPNIHWLISAQDRLEEILAEMGCKGVMGFKSSTTGTGCAPINKQCFPHAYTKLVIGLEQKLAATFPEAETVIVLDFLRSYSTKQKSFVLRVEVTEDNERNEEPRPHAYIVKVAHFIDSIELFEDEPNALNSNGDPLLKMEQKLTNELYGWEICQRRGNHRGRIFMYLWPGKESASHPTLYETIKYEDAHQVLRAAEVINLEKALLDACRWGRPSAESVDDVITQIFYEMSDRFYRRSWTEKARLFSENGYWQDRLNDGIKRWMNIKKQTGKARHDAIASLSEEHMEFIEPCQYWNEIKGGIEFIPEMQRGCSHGDLHGRNIIVGLMEGEAKWPAVYDYEDMRCNNYLGWDFVKLEVELKIRALAKIFKGNDTEFVDQVYTFEVELAKATEKYNNEKLWARQRPLNTGEEALKGIILDIRRMAKKCLDQHRGRQRRWLDEYYFLLFCYGLYAGKFETYHWRDSIATYISTGVAAYRYAWRHGIIEKHKKSAKAYAKVIRTVVSRPRGFALYAYEAKMTLASIYARSRDLLFVQDAVNILEALRKEHYWVVDIGHELAFALLELADLDKEHGDSHKEKAEALLVELEDQFRGGDMELLCRIGRLWKDHADALCETDGLEPKEYYELSLNKYTEAYNIDKDYYPGINVATLYLLLDKKEEAQKTAREVLEILDDIETNNPEKYVNDACWIAATRGEAYLLLEEVSNSIKYYTEACIHPDCEAQNCDTMKKQVQRIVKRQPINEEQNKELMKLF